MLRLGLPKRRIHSEVKKKMKEFQKGVLDNDKVISIENVQRMGEVIALCAIKTVIVHGGKDLHNLYKGLLRDVNRSNDDMSRYSDGYEIAQEAMLFLCQHMGKKLDDVYYTKTGRKITIKQACFSVADRYLTKNYVAPMLNIISLKEQITTEPETILDDEQKNDYTGNVIEYLKSNVTISQDPDDANSSFTAPSFTITYKEVSDGAPINAGDYMVCISIKAGNGYKAVNAKEFTGYFTINTVYPEVIWPTARPISLGQDLSYAWLEGGSSPSTTGVFEWAENPSEPKSGEAYAVKFIPDNKNYREVTTDLADKVEVTVINQRLVTYKTNYGSPQTNIIVKDNTGKVYPSGSVVEKGTVLTIEATTNNDKLEYVGMNISGAASWSGNTCTVGDSSIEIEAIFDVKTPEVPEPEDPDEIIDPNSQYVVTVEKASKNNRGFILGKEGDNGVYYEDAFEFTVYALDEDLDKLVVNGATKIGKGKYRISSVTDNMTVTVSLPNPTQLDVKVVTESKNAKGYLVGKVKAESYPADGKCYYGDELVVVAYPVDGVSFAYWRDNALNKDQMREITVTKDMTIEAVFSGVPTGIEDIESAGIYAGKGYIQVKNVANADLTVVSISGRIQAQQHLEGDVQVRVPAGIYVVVLENGQDVKRVKVIVR